MPKYALWQEGGKTRWIPAWTLNYDRWDFARVYIRLLPVYTCPLGSSAHVYAHIRLRAWVILLESLPVIVGLSMCVWVYKRMQPSFGFVMTFRTVCASASVTCWTLSVFCNHSEIQLIQTVWNQQCTRRAQTSVRVAFPQKWTKKCASDLMSSLLARPN